MRFFLTCLVLAAPLAFAGAANNATFNIAYSNDYVITNSVGQAKIDYGYNGFFKKELIFTTVHNKSEDERSEFLTISGEYLRTGKNKDADLTFAIRSLPSDEYEPILEKRFCVQNSSTALKKMIKACDRGLILKELVADEQKQIQKFQDRVKGLNATVKLIYDRGQTRTESLGFNQFSFEVGDENSLYVSGKKGNSASMYLLESMFFRDFDKEQFVIETVNDKKFKCKDSELNNLIVDCKGPIQVRKLRDDEKLH